MRRCYVRETDGVTMIEIAPEVFVNAKAARRLKLLTRAQTAKKALIYL